MDWSDWIANDIQNWTFKIEDVILHTLTGLIIGIVVKVKSVWNRMKKSLFR